MLEEGLASSVNEALDQDLPVCEQIMDMRSYARLAELERREPKKVSARQYEWLGRVEKQAGVSVVSDKEIEQLAAKLQGR